MTVIIRDLSSRDLLSKLNAYRCNAKAELELNGPFLCYHEVLDLIDEEVSKT